jgi:tRNA(Ile)-lysidine synthase
MLGARDRVLIALSGGPDSTGLLLALSALRRKLGIELVAAHVNHRLRGADADADEACAAASAAELGVPFVRAELSLGGGSANLEARARTLRYAALRRLAAEHGCTHIATGHTRDDQAETVLMRLMRGSGGRGLGAIQPRRADGVIRPLIDCRRGAVAAAVRDVGLPVRLDASNRDPRFLRTHVRERVLPLLAELNPSIAEACANLASAARAERAIITAWADAQLRTLASDGRLSLAGLQALDPTLCPIVLQRWLVGAGVPRRSLGARHLAAVLDIALGPRGRAEAHLPNGWAVRRSRRALRVERDPAPDSDQPSSAASRRAPERRLRRRADTSRICAKENAF